MAAVEYTEEQKKVINLRDANILVSAAAGSGKTAVLTERIISLLLDGKNPVDIDRFLIVTFTKAAAAEMRERISGAISDALEKTPEDEHLQRQSALLHNAQITTIDSFCLFVIRNNFGDIGLDPGFRIMDEGEKKLLMKDVLTEVLESYYEREDEDFHHLVECYCVGGKETELEKLILDLYAFSMSMPYPMEYLECAAADYGKDTPEDIFDAPWWKESEAYRKSLLDTALKESMESLAICQEEGGPARYLPMVSAQAELADKLAQTKLSGAEGYQNCYRLFAENPILAFPGGKSKSEDEELKALAKAHRDVGKACLEELRDKFYSQSPEEIAEESRYISRAAEKLLEVVREFFKAFAAVKREKNVIDFTDMEHFALDILMKKENGEIVPTKTALEYREHFAYVMVDEYQDSNYVQEYILKCVAGDNNYFMVGDIKQSIYRFRLAKPEIFLGKYNTFAETGKDVRIDLNKNFRSRSEVLDSVNDVFEAIMMPPAASMEYDEKAKLKKGAVYPEAEGNVTEMIVIENPEEEEKEALDAAEGKHGVEALYVAERIRSLMQTHRVAQKGGKGTRPIEYRDIVILLRSMEGWGEEFKQMLEEKGIPAFCTEKSGYFSAMEVKEVLNFLQVLNNPKQDIPFYGVMTSYFGGFTEEEAAQIKAAEMEKRPADAPTPFLYDALLAYDGEGLKEKKERLLERIASYRDKVSYVKIRDLLELILRETGYMEYVTAMPGGQKRKANLLLLLEKARVFESTSYHGLFHFVRYINQLKEQDVDYGEAGAPDENANVVRIMTIHKSKGLEFPVCFLCGMGKKINKKDAGNAVLADTQLGIGLDYINPLERVKRSGFKKRMMSHKITAECIAEEMRVLYVAMTRAKEKLIMTAVVPDAEKCADKLPEKGALSLLEISKASTCLDFILQAYADRGRLTDYVHFLTAQDLQAMGIAAEVKKEIAYQKLEEEPSGELREAIREKFAFVYGYPELKGLYTKTTVSELKKLAYEEHDGVLMFEEPEREAYIPAFVRETEEGSVGTVRGSAYHRVMELVPYRNLPEESSAQEEFLQKVIADNLSAGRLSKEYADLVRIKKCRGFLESPLAGRMREADRNGLLFKEKAFFMGVPAKELRDSFPEKETILVQGVIDVYFEEEGELVLADYKTDRVSAEEELIKRYRVQLDIYARALEQITGKKVKEKIIYSFALNKVISI